MQLIRLLVLTDSEGQLNKVLFHPDKHQQICEQFLVGFWFLAGRSPEWFDKSKSLLSAGIVVAMLAFLIAMFVHDPAISIGSWAIVGVIAGLNALWNWKHRPPPGNPDGTTEGTGIPIPRVPSPLLRVGTTARDIPAKRERYG